MDTIKRNLAIFVASLFLFAQVCAAERTAPVFPNNSTIESGKSYYLYNVGSDKFLTTKLEVGEYAKAVAVDVIQKEDGSYTLQYSSDKYYIYTNMLYFIIIFSYTSVFVVLIAHIFNTVLCK